MAQRKEGIELPPFEAMNQIARDLLSVALKFEVHRTGRNVVEAEGEGGNERSLQERLLTVLDIEKWLKEQVSMYRDARDRAATTSASSSAKKQRKDKSGVEAQAQADLVEEEEKANERVWKLQQLYSTIVGQRSRDEAVVAHFRENPVLSAVLFGGAEGSKEENGGDQLPERTILRNSVHRRDELVSEALRLAAELRGVRLERMAAEALARGLKIDTRHAFGELRRSIQIQKRNAREGGSDGDGDESGGDEAGADRADAKLGVILTKNTIVRRVLQALVLESQVNWAEDAGLRATMLNMENEV